jgi:hypothetical protein
MVTEQTVDKQANVQATFNLTPAQETLQALWNEHLRLEFDTHNTEDTLATIVEDLALKRTDRSCWRSQLRDKNSLIINSIGVIS